jgi:hypothetical protein
MEYDEIFDAKIVRSKCGVEGEVTSFDAIWLGNIACNGRNLTAEVTQANGERYRLKICDLTLVSKRK